jgi:hypothetical protein
LDRFSTRESGRQTRHSFSFGESYDPDRVSFGPMIALNDDLLGGGAGYDAHEHADVVLVSWVVFGELTHTDADGTLVLPAGHSLIDRTGAGTSHSERTGEAATRFLQMWLRPDEPGGPTSAVRSGFDLDADPHAAVVTDGARQLGVAGATLDVHRVASGESVTLPDAPLAYLFVVTGALARSSLAEPLSAGDAFEITGEPGTSVTAAVPTDLLVWTFSSV